MHLTFPEDHTRRGQSDCQPETGQRWALGVPGTMLRGIQNAGLVQRKSAKFTSAIYSMSVACAIRSFTVCPPPKSRIAQSRRSSAPPSREPEKTFGGILLAGRIAPRKPGVARQTLHSTHLIRQKKASDSAIIAALGSHAATIGSIVCRSPRSEPTLAST